MELGGLNFVIDPDDGDTTIHHAAFLGDINTLREILESSEGSNLKDARVRPFGSTPLRLAASAGKTECVQELLKHGADVSVADIKAQTPLFTAVYNGHFEVFKLLLKAGADPNGDARNILNPIHVACSNGFTAAVKLLLQYGVSLEGSFAHPLLLTVSGGHFDSFVLLLLYGAQTNLPQYSAHEPSLVRVLLTSRECTPMFFKIWVLFGGSAWVKDSKGDIVEVEASPGAMADMVNSYRETPLPLKCQCRIQIWRSVKHNVLEHLSTFFIPKTLMDFLSYRDIPEVKQWVDVILQK